MLHVITRDRPTSLGEYCIYHAASWEMRQGAVGCGTWALQW